MVGGPQTTRPRVALVCTNFTMQSAFGLLIVALNSARLGYETLIYFTFEGLHMIRPGHLRQLRYYPTGVDPSETQVDELTEKLRAKMYRKDIPYVEDMLEMAQLEGVELIACKMTVDMMEIDESKLIEGVVVWTAEDFLKYAKDCKICLFT